MNYTNTFIIAFTLFVTSQICTQEIINEAVESTFAAEFHTEPEQFANLVARRHYFIRRLQESIETFIKIEHHRKSFIPFAVVLSSINVNGFKHPQIRNSILAIKKTQSLSPLFLLWDDFLAFKLLQDQLFVEELTKEICIITGAIAMSMQAHKNTDPADLMTISEQIDAINRNIRTIKYAIKNHYKFGQEKEWQEESEEEELSEDGFPDEDTQDELNNNRFVSINTLMEHYYLHKRLEHTVTILKIAEQNGLYQTYLPEVKNSLDQIKFHDKVTKKCLKKIAADSSLKELFAVWRKIQCYQFINNHAFNREFLILVAVNLSTLIDAHNKKIKNSKGIDDVAHLAESLDNLPIEEILSLIDTLTNEIPKLLEKYELNNSDLTWKEWAKKYWWLPPFAVAAITFKMFLVYRMFTKNQ